MNLAPLFGNLAGGNSSEGSSQNAIEKLNLLEEDDDDDGSEIYDGPVNTLFDTD